MEFRIDVFKYLFNSKVTVLTCQGRGMKYIKNDFDHEYFNDGWDVFKNNNDTGESYFIDFPRFSHNQDFVELLSVHIIFL